jgi:hypothetical protein
MGTKRKRGSKKEKAHKSVEERIEIVRDIIAKLIEVNLVAIDENDKVYSGFESIQEFLNILEEYKKPVLLSGFTGVIKVPEFKRNIEYILPLSRHVIHGVRMVVDDPKDYVV